MRYNAHFHNRHSIRLPTYDYTHAGAYFVTICTHSRELLLDHRLIRQIVSDAWRDLARRFPSVRLDQFVVMPNHVHAIIWTTAPAPVRAQHHASLNDNPSPTGAPSWKSPLPPDSVAPLRPAIESPIAPSNHASPLRPAALKRNSLGLIVHAFKSRSAKRINRLRRTPGAPVWQRNYYEHIVRSEEDLHRIRQYIIDNPAKWAKDQDNPANRPTASSNDTNRRGAA